MDRSVKKIVLSVVFGILALIALAAAFSSFYTVDEGERAVVLRNGSFSHIASPGLNWKIPFVDKSVVISTRSSTSSYPNLKAYSRDQQSADLNVSVTFSVPEGNVETMYSKYGGVERFKANLLDRIVPDRMERIFGQYNAITAVQQRTKLGNDLSKSIREAVDSTVIVESVQIQNIDFSDAYEKSVEQRMQAEVGVETQNQYWEKEKVNAEIKITQAKAEAASQLAQAEAAAKAKRLDGEAEAAAIEAKGRALAQTPGLIEYTKASRWDGKLPTTMLPDATLPFFNTDKLATQ